MWGLHVLKESDWILPLFWSDCWHHVLNNADQNSWIILYVGTVLGRRPYKWHPLISNTLAMILPDEEIILAFLGSELPCFHCTFAPQQFSWINQITEQSENSSLSKCWAGLEWHISPLVLWCKEESIDILQCQYTSSLR